MKKVFAVYHRKVCEVVDGKFVDGVRDMRVRVLAQAEGYALVRRKAAGTFAVSLKELSIGAQGGEE